MLVVYTKRRLQREILFVSNCRLLFIEIIKGTITERRNLTKSSIRGNLFTPPH